MPPGSLSSHRPVLTKFPNTAQTPANIQHREKPLTEVKSCTYHSSTSCTDWVAKLYDGLIGIYEERERKIQLTVSEAGPVGNTLAKTYLMQNLVGITKTIRLGRQNVILQEGVATYPIKFDQLGKQQPLHLKLISVIRSAIF